MTWGMLLPNSFGDFFPGSSIEVDRQSESGWYDRLTAHYEAQPPEERKRLFDYRGDPEAAAHFYGTFPSYKLVKEPGTADKSGLEPPYGSLQPHELPRSLDIAGSARNLGSLIKLPGKILAVDEQLKTIIEHFEPAVHEFFALPVRYRRGDLYPRQFFILRICQYRSAFSLPDTKSSSVEVLPANDERPELIFVNRSKAAVNGLAFRRSDIAGAHLWRDRTFGEDMLFFSDELMDAIEQQDLRIPKHYEVQHV